MIFFYKILVFYIVFHTIFSIRHQFIDLHFIILHSKMFVSKNNILKKWRVHWNIKHWNIMKIFNYSKSMTIKNRYFQLIIFLIIFRSKFNSPMNVFSRSIPMNLIKCINYNLIFFVMKNNIMMNNSQTDLLFHTLVRIHLMALFHQISI